MRCLDAAAALASRHTERAYLVKEGKKEAQMQEVAIRFKVHLSPSNIMSRCSLCNGEFERSRLRAEDLQEGHEVPEGVMATRDVFWRCADCQQVYWEGCKFQNALERLSGRIDALGIGGS